MTVMYCMSCVSSVTEKNSRQYSRVAKSFLKNTVNARQCDASI